MINEQDSKPHNYVFKKLYITKNTNVQLFSVSDKTYNKFEQIIDVILIFIKKQNLRHSKTKSI